MKNAQRIYVVVCPDGRAREQGGCVGAFPSILAAREEARYLDGGCCSACDRTARGRKHRVVVLTVPEERRP